MPSLITTTSLLDDPAADRFDFGPAKAPAPVLPGPGKGFSSTKIGGDWVFKLKSDYKVDIPGLHQHFAGTAGDDTINWPTLSTKAKHSAGFVVIGGGGDDVLNSPANGTVRDTLYGDGAAEGVGFLVPGGKSGNDQLHLGANDFGKSGPGKDVYNAHGPGVPGYTIKLWFNFDDDHLNMAGKVSLVDFEIVKYSADKKAVLLDRIMLLGDTDNPKTPYPDDPINDGQHVTMLLNTNREADMPDVWAPNYGGGAFTLADAQKWWAVHDQDILL